MAGWSPRGSPALGPTGTLDLGRGTECGQEHPPKDGGGGALPPAPALPCPRPGPCAADASALPGGARVTPSRPPGSGVQKPLRRERGG